MQVYVLAVKISTLQGVPVSVALYQGCRGSCCYGRVATSTFYRPTASEKAAVGCRTFENLQLVCRAFETSRTAAAFSLAVVQQCSHSTVWVGQVDITYRT